MEEFHDYQKKIEDDLERMLEMELLNLAKEVRKMPIEKLWESRKQNAKSGNEAAKPSRDSEDIKAEAWMIFSMARFYTNSTRNTA